MATQFELPERPFDLSVSTRPKITERYAPLSGTWAIERRSGFGNSWPGVASMLNASPVPARRQGKVRAAAYLRAPVMDASLRDRKQTCQRTLRACAPGGRWWASLAIPIGHLCPV
jgi:hypothetical protein